MRLPKFGVGAIFDMLNTRPESYVYLKPFFIPWHERLSQGDHNIVSVEWKLQLMVVVLVVVKSKYITIKWQLQLVFIACMKTSLCRLRICLYHIILFNTDNSMNNSNLRSGNVIAGYNFIHCTVPPHLPCLIGLSKWYCSCGTHAHLTDPLRCTVVNTVYILDSIQYFIVKLGYF